SDIFSFGSVLYQTATGRRPFVGDTRAALLGSLLRDVPPRITDSRPDCPSELDRIIRKSLQKERERRYGSMREMLSDLEMLRDDRAAARASPGSDSQLRASSRFERPRPPMARRELGAWVAVAALLLAVLLLGYDVLDLRAGNVTHLRL